MADPPSSRAGRWRARLFRAGARVAVLVPVLAGILLLAVFPLRTWLSQREDIADTRARLDRLERENARLDAEAARLSSPEEIEHLAREQFNLVRPGEDAYAIIAAPTPTAPTTTVPPTTTAPAPPP